MGKGRKLMWIMLITLTNLLVGCGQNPKKEEEISIFNVQEAYSVAYEYLYYIKNEDLSSANSLCTKELLNKNNIIKEGSTDVIAFAKEDIKEGRDSAYITFRVVRGKNGEAKSDLDNFTIKVSKKDKAYKIEEVKSNTKKQVFLRNNSLRVIGENGGDSNLLIRLTDLPKEVYLPGNEVMLYKAKTPLLKFTDIDLAYSGNLIGVSTSDDKNSFVTLIIMDDATNKKEANRYNIIQTLAPDTSGISEDIKDELLDKPIAQKVIPLDILQNSIIKNFIFTPNNDDVIVGYLEGGVNRIKAYNATNGESIKLEFDSIFPKEKYNMEVLKVDEQGVFIEVSEFKDANKNLLGYYKINMKLPKIEKVESID